MNRLSGKKSCRARRTDQPKWRVPSFTQFLVWDGAIPAVVESKNKCGGMRPGFRTIAWCFDGSHFALQSAGGRAVWCHADNLTVLSRGTVEGLDPALPVVKHYFSHL